MAILDSLSQTSASKSDQPLRRLAHWSARLLRTASIMLQQYRASQAAAHLYEQLRTTDPNVLKQAGLSRQCLASEIKQRLEITDDRTTSDD